MTDKKVIVQLGELQENYFKMSGDLYENKELLGDELYLLMLADITTTYKREKQILLESARLEYETAIYKIDCKETQTKPARRPILFWKRNEPADLIYREINVEVQKNFNRRTEALEKLEAALKQATKTARPDDEPRTDEPEQTEPKEAAKPPETATKTEQGDVPTAADSTLSANSGTPPRVQEQGTKVR